MIVIVKDGQTIKSEESGERGRLVTHALFEAPVTRNDPRAVVDEILAVIAAQYSFGDRHPDAVRKPLPERTRRRLNARGQRVAEDPLGVARRARVRLAKRP